MARHDLQTTQLRCPDQTCGGAMVRDECGVFCQVCGFEAVTWADPVDADVPMNVIVRRERTKRCVLASAIAALFIACAGALFWALPSQSESMPSANNRTALTFVELRDALAAQRLPEGLDLPAFYRDPDLFLLPRERTAQSELVLFWNTRSSDEKLELLRFVKDAESLILLPFVAEVAFYTAAQEQDRLVGESLLAALHASCYDHLDLVHFVCDFMRVSTPVAEVRVHAASYVAALDERRRNLGR